MLRQKDNHLSSQEVAMCADAIMEKRLEQLPADIKAHLQDCDQCSAEVSMVVDIASPETNVREIQENKPRFNYPVFVLLAAAVVLGFILLVVLPLSQSSGDQGQNLLADQNIRETDIQERDEGEKIEEKEEEKTDEQPDDIIEPNIATIDDSAEITPNKEPESTLLADFTPHRELEMLANNFQSAYRGSNISITTDGSISYPDQTSLVWENPRGNALLVEIFDNDGNEIFTVSTSEASVDIPDIDPGLYYWKLIEEDDFDLIFVGKIIYQP